MMTREYGKGYDEGYADGLKDATQSLAQPEQEPVAWVNQANLNSAAIQRNRGGQGDTHTWSETPNAFCPIPLYTTPPQRKPLTDGEMDAVIDGCPKYHWRFSTKDPNGKLNYYELIRAIEAAHGIKE